MANTFFWGNQWWGPNDKAAFTRWLQQHGASYNLWARNHPALATKMFGSSSASSTSALDNLLAEATSQVDSNIKAQEGLINTQRQHTADQNQNLINNTKEAYAALAGLLGNVGPQVAGIYNNAASEDSAIAKGFADAQASIQKGEASTVGDFLGKIGAPAEQIQQVLEKAGGPGAADVVYGLGGGMNASGLAREGAAFGSAAAMLPGEAAGIGQQNILTSAQKAMQDDQTFQDQLNQLYAGRGASIQDVLAKLQDNARQDRALRDQELSLGNTLTNTAHDNALADAEFAQGQQTATAKAAASAKANRQAAVKAREDAFASARQDIFKQAKGLLKPMSVDEQIAWMAQHPGKKPPAMTGPSYAQAKKMLFNQYKDLLRYATRAGRSALKKRLNQMIDEALAAAGFTPPKPASGGYSYATGPRAGTHPGERPT